MFVMMYAGLQLYLSAVWICCYVLGIYWNGWNDRQWLAGEKSLDQIWRRLFFWCIQVESTTRSFAILSFFVRTQDSPGHRSENNQNFIFLPIFFYLLSFYIDVFLTILSHHSVWLNILSQKTLKKCFLVLEGCNIDTRNIYASMGSWLAISKIFMN